MPTYTNDQPELVILGDVKDDGSPDIANVLFTFPVPHQQMRVRQEAKIDEVEIPGRSGKVKQAVGYQDSSIEISITLVDEEDASGVVSSAVEQFKDLQDAFRKRDKESLPRMFSVSSRLTDACRIKTVLFKGMEVNDTQGANDLAVTISLTEFEPIEMQVERQALEKVTAQAAGQEAGAAADANADLAEEIGAEPNPLSAAFRQGRADAMGGEYDGELPGDEHIRHQRRHDRQRQRYWCPDHPLAGSSHCTGKLDRGTDGNHFDAGDGGPMNEWRKIERVPFVEKLRKVNETFANISAEMLLRDAKRLKAMAEYIANREMEKAGNG